MLSGERFFGFVIAGLLVCGFSSAQTARMPEKQRVVVGTLYDTAGPYATGSMLQYNGLLLWAKEANRAGGIALPKSGKKVPVEVVSYDTQSDPAAAAVRYERLITQDKVDILFAGFGSTMTAPGLPIAQKHKTVLWNLSSTTPEYFTADNKYHVLLTMPVSTEWPRMLAAYLVSKQEQIKRVAILYDKEEWPQAQASRLREALKKAGTQVTYYEGYLRDTSNFIPLIQSASASRPDALVHFGYEVHDRDFIRQFRDIGAKTKILFAMWPGMSFASMAKGIGKSMSYVTTYIAPPAVKIRNVSHGMDLDLFRKNWTSTYPKEPLGLFSVVGYAGGRIIEHIVANANSLAASDLRAAAVKLSKQITTIRGQYSIDPETGAQLGSELYVGQIFPDESGGVRIAPIFPPAVATKPAVIPLQ